MNPMAGLQQNPFSTESPDKLFKVEGENLKLLKHEWVMDGIEERLVKATS
jgi:hypothetical protein